MDNMKSFYASKYGCVFNKPYFYMHVPISYETLPGKMKMLEFIIQDHMSSLYVSNHLYHVYVDVKHDDWSNKIWVQIHAKIKYVPDEHTHIQMYNDLIERFENVVRCY